MLAEALEHLVRGIVDSPRTSRSAAKNNRRGETLEVRVHQEDLGRVIGRQGRTARALRTVVAALAAASRSGSTSSTPTAAGNALGSITCLAVRPLHQLMVEGPDCFTARPRQLPPQHSHERPGTEEQHAASGGTDRQAPRNPRRGDGPGAHEPPRPLCPRHRVRGGAGLGRAPDRRRARWNKDILLLAFEEIETRNAGRDPARRQAVHRNRGARRGRRRGWYEHELVGLEARVGVQVVGKVAGLHTMPVQDLLVVETPTARKSWCPSWSRSCPRSTSRTGYVLVTPPAGLFEINDRRQPAADETAPEGNA